MVWGHAAPPARALHFMLWTKTFCHNTLADILVAHFCKHFKNRLFCVPVFARAHPNRRRPERSSSVQDCAGGRHSSAWYSLLLSMRLHNLEGAKRTWITLPKGSKRTWITPPPALSLNTNSTVLGGRAREGDSGSGWAEGGEAGRARGWWRRRWWRGRRARRGAHGPPATVTAAVSSTRAASVQGGPPRPRAESATEKEATGASWGSVLWNTCS